MDTITKSRARGLELTIPEHRRSATAPDTGLHSPLPGWDASCHPSSAKCFRSVHSSNSLASQTSQTSQQSQPAGSPGCDVGLALVLSRPPKWATDRAPQARIEAAGTTMPGEPSEIAATRSFKELSSTREEAQAAVKGRMGPGRITARHFQKSRPLKKGSVDCIRRICSERVEAVSDAFSSAVPRSRGAVLSPAARALAGVNRLLPVQARHFNSRLSESDSASASRAARCVREAHLEDASKEEIDIIEQALPVGIKLVEVKRVYNFGPTKRFSSRNRAALREAEDSEKMMWHHVTYGDAEAVSCSRDGVDAKRQLRGCYGYASLLTHTFALPQPSPGTARTVKAKQAKQTKQAVLVRAVLGRSKDLGPRADIGTRGMRATPHRCYGSVHGTPGESGGWEEGTVVYGVYDKASLCPAYVVTYQEQATWVKDESEPPVKL